MQITKAEFEQEKRYQSIVYFLRQMRKRDLITEDEYHHMCKEYAERFCPKTGTLLNEINLICGFF